MTTLYMRATPTDSGCCRVSRISQTDRGLLWVVLNPSLRFRVLQSARKVLRINAVSLRMLPHRHEGRPLPRRHLEAVDKRSQDGTRNFIVRRCNGHAQCPRICMAINTHGGVTFTQVS